MSRIAVCAMCGKEFNPKPRQIYCGSKKLKLGCSHINDLNSRKENKWNKTEKGKEYHRIYDKVWRKEQRESNTPYANRQRELQKKYHSLNKEKIFEYMQEWRKNNKELILFNNSQYRRSKLNAGSFSLEEWHNKLDEYNHMCGKCGILEKGLSEKYGKQFKSLTVDHIIPLSKGGTNTIDNIWPLCVGCNSSKHDEKIEFRVVYTGGSFDGVHIGHVNFLRQCRKIIGPYGKLVVALNTDDFIRQYKKLPPIFSFEERKEQLLKTGYVHQVIPNIGGSDSKPTILQVQPDFIVVGSDWAKKDYYAQMGFTQQWLDENNIILLYIPYTENISTTILREKIKNE